MRYKFYPMTIEEFNDLFECDPSLGTLRWKFPSSTKVIPGSLAGSLDGNGYYKIQYKSRRYLSHRLIWLAVYGSWPLGYIEHINKDKRDNRISNLRLKE